MPGPEAQIVEIFSGIQGEGTSCGERHLFVRLAGCNLDCDYCDTPGAHGWTAPAEVEERSGSRTFVKKANPMGPREVAGEVLRLSRELPHAAVAWTGGEPLWSAAFLKEAVPPLKEAGLRQFLETNGTLPDELRRVVDLFDEFSVDVKLPSLSRGVRDLAVCERFLDMLKGKRGCAKLVFCETTTRDEIESAARIARDAAMPLVLQPVSPVPGGPSRALRALVAPPSLKRILAAQAEALAVHGDVRVIPQLHLVLGDR